MYLSGKEPIESGNGQQNLEGDQANLSQSKFVAADLTSSIVPAGLRAPVSDRNPFTNCVTQHASV